MSNLEAVLDDAARLMARMTAHGVQIRGDCGGGTPAWFTVSDIAACCAGLPALDGDLLLAKYTGDQRAALKAIGPVTDLLLKAGCERAQLCATVALAIVTGNEKCKRCKGRAHVLNRKAVVVQCDQCDGSGLRRVTYAEMARAVGLDRHTFDRKCRDAMDKVIARLQGLETSALLHVWRRARRMMVAC